MKKIIALAMAGVMTAGMTSVAFAAAQKPVVAIGYEEDATSTNTEYYVIKDGVAKPAGDASSSTVTVKGGDKIAIPLTVWTDDNTIGTVEANEMKWFGTSIDDVKLPKAYATWKVGSADVAVSKDIIKYDLQDNGTYTFIESVIVTLPENDTNKVVDLVGTISLGSKTNYDAHEKFELKLSYAPSRKDATPISSADLTKPGEAGIVSFDAEEGEYDIEFGDELLFTVDVTGQGKLNLTWNTSFDKEIAAMYPTANLDFLGFDGAPAFNKTGTAYLYADKSAYVYEVKNGKVVALDATYDEDYEAYAFKTRTLGPVSYTHLVWHSKFTSAKNFMKIL